MDSSDSVDDDTSIIRRLRNASFDNFSEDGENVIPDVELPDDETTSSLTSSSDIGFETNDVQLHHGLEITSSDLDIGGSGSFSTVDGQDRTNQSINSVHYEENEPNVILLENRMNATPSDVENGTLYYEDDNVTHDTYEEEIADLEELLEGLEDDEMDDNNIHHRNLLEMIGNEHANEIIDADFTVTVPEMWLAILKFSSQHCLPTIAISNMCRMINTFFDRQIIGQTRYRIDQLFYPDAGKKYHAVCSECRNYIGLFNQDKRPLQCNICNEIVDLKDPCYRDYFVTFEFVRDIKSIIEMNSEFYLNAMNELNNTNDLTNFRSGKKYRNFVRSLPYNHRKSYATVIFNSDGLPVFKSSKLSIWPIQAVLNEVPEHVRNKKTIVCGLWFGHDKPNMLYFLRSFVSTMNEIGDRGIECNFNGQLKHVYVHALCCCVDSAARPCMQGIIQYNGYYGCNWCLHPGQRVFHNRGGAITYILLDEIPARRTHEGTLENMERAINSPVPIFGVKNPTPLINLNHFNIVDGFVPDPMHCIDLGIAKKFMEYWFHTANFPYSVLKHYQELIDKQLKAFKVPNQVMRLSRPIKDSSYWKAKELQNWILYYSVPALAEIPEFRDYFEHWCLLVEAYHLLLQDTVTLANLRRADLLLKIFVSHTEVLYGAYAMTFNVHQLLHLSQSVADWGPYRVIQVILLKLETIGYCRLSMRQKEC